MADSHTAGGGPSVVLVVGDVVDDDVVRPCEPVTWGGETRARIVALPGGSAANQAAWLGALGTRVRFTGRVGAAGARWHAAELRRHGVDARLVADPLTPTGTIIVLVSPDGERDMYTDPGANGNLAVADLGDELLDDVGLVHLSGYPFFQPGPRAAVTDLASRAAARGIALSVDPGSAALLRRAGPEVFLGWTRGMRMIFPNLAEGRVLAGRTDPAAIADTLVTHYPVVVLKLGADGVLAATRTGLRLRRPALPAQVADTTGAGDALCAGFLAGWAAQRRPADPSPAAGSVVGPIAVRATGLTAESPIPVSAAEMDRCVALGQYAAAMAVARLGARPGGRGHATGGRTGQGPAISGAGPSSD